MIDVSILETDSVISHAIKGLIVVDKEGLSRIKRRPFNYKPALFTEGVLDKLGFEIKETNSDGGDHYYSLVIDEMVFTSHRPFDTVELNDISIGAVHGLQSIISSCLSKRLDISKF